MFRSRRLPALLLALLSLAWMPTATAAESLYDRLGGEAAVTAITTELVQISRTDPVSGHLFRKVNHKRLAAKIALQICALTGGGCIFDGDDMKTTHAGFVITETDFYRLVEHLVEILDRRGVGTREKNELLAVLAPLKRDVVTR